MAKKRGSIWDNPFGGLFDINGDGREDFIEQWLAAKVIEECTRKDDVPEKDDYIYDWRLYCEDGSDVGIAPDDYASEYDYKEALKEARAMRWRSTCEDGFDLGVDPEDYDTEEEYEEALEEARDRWRSNCEDGSDVGIDPEDYDTEDEYMDALEEARAEQPGQIKLSIQVEIPGMKALDAIQQDDYPNKRMYYAAFHLQDVQQGTAYISSDSSADAEIERCQFILNSGTVAGRYLTAFDGFLYAQAVKEHFPLPIDIPDEDETVKTSFNDLMLEVAEEDPKLAVEIWGWCIKEFGPYPQYMDRKGTLYTHVLWSVNQYPDAFLDIAAHAIGTDPAFCEGLLAKSPEYPSCCAPVIMRALKNGLAEEASRMFQAAMQNPTGKGKDLEDLINRIISDCSDWKELETMEAFQQHLLPIMEKLDNKRIQRLYPQFVQKVSEYISYVEKNSEQYQYSRKYAWRKTCQDGSAYNIDPLRYEAEQEYDQAIYNEKYAWRQWAAYDAKKYGIDPTAFEKEADFNAAVSVAQQMELQKRREEQRQRRNASYNNYTDPLASSDKTVYTFCGVVFESSPTIYYYRMTDDSISIGDFIAVSVGRGGKDAVAEVVTIQKHRRATAPYPVDRAKFIKGKYTG